MSKCYVLTPETLSASSGSVEATSSDLLVLVGILVACGTLTCSPHNSKVAVAPLLADHRQSLSSDHFENLWKVEKGTMKLARENVLHPDLTSCLGAGFYTLGRTDSYSYSYSYSSDWRLHYSYSSDSRRTSQLLEGGCYNHVAIVPSWLRVLHCSCSSDSRRTSRLSEGGCYNPVAVVPLWLRVLLSALNYP